MSEIFNKSKKESAQLLVSVFMKKYKGVIVRMSAKKKAIPSPSVERW